MVLLKEISEGIWGLTLGPDKTSEIVADHPFRLTMAALEIDDENESTTNSITRVTIKSSTADKGPPTDLILCNLHYPSCLQQPLDIEFYDGQTLTFGAKGPYKVHLTGYVLQPELQEMCEEGHVHAGKSHGIFEAANESSDDDDDEDDDDDDDDDSDDDIENLHVARRHKLRDDEDQELEGDYEDGYLEGEDQLGSDTSSSSDSDDDDQPKKVAASDKGKKRPRPESNGHAKKQEPESKKVKKNKTTKEEPTKTNDAESKKAKKQAKQAPASSTDTSAATTTSTTVDAKKKTNSLEINDMRVGNGPEATLGKTAAVYYTGRLKSNNKAFDSCNKGKPFRFRLGAGEVIRGWDQGVKGMRVGGKRRITIPPSLAYGSQKLPDIPANSTLVFDIELKNVF